MSRAARRTPAVLPPGRWLNYRIRLTDNHEAVIRWSSGGSHVKLTVGKLRTASWIMRLSMDN
jgi:hypothetical protein